MVKVCVRVVKARVCGVKVCVRVVKARAGVCRETDASQVC